jgi:ketosteroid isomerase-like protein
LSTGQSSGGGVVELWQTLVGAITGGDMASARSHVTPGFEWQVMGRSPQAGRYVGVEGLSELFNKVQVASDHTFQLETEITLGDDETAVIVGRVTASRNGRTLEGRNMFMLQAENGLIARGWTIPIDQYAFDEFWV